MTPFPPVPPAPTVSVTLVSMSPTATTVVGLGLGTLSGTTACTLTSTNPTAVAGPAAQISVSENAGKYCVEIFDVLRLYGPTPPLDGIDAGNLFRRLAHDKKTVRGKVHFILPVRIGEVVVVSDVEEPLVREAIQSALS